jgi:hypothetical protein
MVRLFLVVQVPHARHQRGVALALSPLDRFVLRLEGGEYVVRRILDDIVIDRITSLRPLGRASTYHHNLSLFTGWPDCVRWVALSPALEPRTVECRFGHFLPVKPLIPKRYAICRSHWQKVYEALRLKMVDDAGTRVVAEKIIGRRIPMGRVASHD